RAAASPSRQGNPIHKKATLVAVLAPLGVVSLPRPWADERVRVVRQGADGRDGETAFGWTQATKGEDAADANWTQNTPIRNAKPTVIEVGSQGGAGGSVYTKGVFHNVPGKPGGKAGNVCLTVATSADLTGTLDGATLDK